eukprot:TRINITY_DN10177_c0_g2_i1.p1 TRINITY_DN10177_c0_g2~~TRINITY_DN10177_c0_g2_i1.p1  ORF type:complete len:347 (+),score=46.76 TRINITY_DN10177_c0_g2_i1:30-1070(+)
MVNATPQAQGGEAGEASQRSQQQQQGMGKCGTVKSEGESDGDEGKDRKRVMQSSQQQDQSNKRHRLGMESSMGIGVGMSGNPQMYGQYNKMYGYMNPMAAWTGQQRGGSYPARGATQPNVLQHSNPLSQSQPNQQLSAQKLGVETQSGPICSGQAIGGGVSKPQLTVPTPVPTQPITGNIPPLSSTPAPTTSGIIPEGRIRSATNVLPRPSRLNQRPVGFEDGKVLPLRGLQALIRNTGFNKNYEFDVAAQLEIQNTLQNLLTDVIEQGLTIAKRRKSTKLEVSDLEAALELKHHIRIPGFAKSNNALVKRQFHRPSGNDIHKRIQADVRRSQAQATKAFQKAGNN